MLRCNRAAASNLWVLVGLHGMAGGQFGGEQAQGPQANLHLHAWPLDLHSLHSTARMRTAG